MACFRKPVVAVMSTGSEVSCCSIQFVEVCCLLSVCVHVVSNVGRSLLSCCITSLPIELKVGGAVLLHCMLVFLKFFSWRNSFSVVFV